MERKLYNYEIVLSLFNENKHLRQIAKELNINHMTIKRALTKLVKNNILDIKVAGRNNIFSLKDSLEARNTLFMSEYYKFNNFIKTHSELKQSLIALKILPVNLIVIFGSYARGNESKGSDIDIYIETQKESIKKQAQEINKKFSIKIGKYNKENLLIKEIEKSHIIVKGVEQFYEKNKLFNPT